MQNKTAHHLTIHHLSSTDVCTVHDRRAVVFAKAKLLVSISWAQETCLAATIFVLFVETNMSIWTKKTKLLTSTITICRRPNLKFCRPSCQVGKIGLYSAVVMRFDNLLSFPASAAKWPHFLLGFWRLPWCGRMGYGVTCPRANVSHHDRIMVKLVRVRNRVWIS